MTTIAILGAGGHGRVVADCAQSLGWNRILVFDDGSPTPLPEPWVHAGLSSDLLNSLPQMAGVAVAIGSNRVRLDWHRRLVALGAPLVTLVHPQAYVSPHTFIGAGTVVLAGAVINIGSKVGEAVIVNTGATIDHDCNLADGVHVSPGAHLAGGVSVGESSWIGIGAAVRERITIGNQVMVGAGAAVVAPVMDNHTIVGVPARALTTG